MKISEMTDTMFDREMATLLGQVQFWCIRLSNLDPAYILDPKPIVVGNKKYPFPFAADLWQLWDYARGTGPRPNEVQENIQKLCELLWAPVAAGSYDIPSDWWDTPLGTMCRLCNARATLEAGWSLDVYEMALLADLTHMRIRQLCQSGELQAVKEERNGSSQEKWIIPAEEARRFLESRTA